MNLDSGFADLRLNRQDNQSQDSSFWPSFTDIMTVIVMIFLIALVVLLLRNMDLVKQLRATMEAEHTAIELARTTGEEKASLVLKLIKAESKLSMLRMQLMQLQEAYQKHENTIDTQATHLSDLLAERERLTLRKDQLEAKTFSLSQQLKGAQSTISTLEQEKGALEQKLESSQQQLAEMHSDIGNLESRHETTLQHLVTLQERYSRQTTTLEESRTLERGSRQEISALKNEYDLLKFEYNKLIKPARSPKDRFVVEIRYSKVDEGLRIEYKMPKQKQFQTIDEGGLHKHLTELKAAHENGLYIKVIFPEASGLSFNEAWTFTSDLHRDYDYYFEGEGPAPVQTVIPR